MTSPAPFLSERTGDRPSIDELVARAHEQLPYLPDRAHATELDRRVSAETVNRLKGERLLSVCQPRRFGGFEYGPQALVLLGHELGQACTSSAWIAGLANCNAWFASYWPLEVQQEIWGQDPDNVIAAPLAPTGSCERTTGGYLVSGRWPWASNCENSEWAIVSAIVPENEESPAGPVWLLTPMANLSVDQDTWHVAGLQGTGSKTLYSEEQIFIPDVYAVRVSDVVDGTTPGVSLDDNPLADFSWSTFGAAALVGPLLGAARGALNVFAEDMRRKIRPGHLTTSAHNPFVQERAGRAEAALDAAFALLVQDLHDAERIVFSGEKLSVSERVRVRRSLNFAARQALFVVNELYEGAGASSADLTRPLQRMWRDVNAGGQHVSLDDRSVMLMAGQNLFGLPPVGAY